MDESIELQKVVLGQSDQLRALNGVLERTVNVKLEYEEVIKQLLLNDSIKDHVIEVCMRNR